ncbi:MAG: hypothetical protein ACYDCJ_03120 [Gammaproteobacteria bacterium]
MKKLQFREINWYAITYDVLLVIISMGTVWLLPFEQLSRVNLEFILVYLNGITIAMFHNRKLQVADYSVYLIMMAAGGIMIVLMMLSDPILLNIGLLVLHGKIEESVEALSNITADVRNFVMFIGIGAVYASIAGMMRLAFLKFVRSFVQNQSKKYI